VNILNELKFAIGNWYLQFVIEVPSLFGRGFGGEGMVDGYKEEKTSSRSSALTLALSQRERGRTFNSK
jgi:hypothetical protein